jgi:hypothetical protein
MAGINVPLLGGTSQQDKHQAMIHALYTHAVLHMTGIITPLRFETKSPDEIVAEAKLYAYAIVKEITGAEPLEKKVENA